MSASINLVIEPISSCKELRRLCNLMRFFSVSVRRVIQHKLRRSITH